MLKRIGVLMIALSFIASNGYVMAHDDQKAIDKAYEQGLADGMELVLEATVVPKQGGDSGDYADAPDDIEDVDISDIPVTTPEGEFIGNFPKNRWNDDPHRVEGE
ncbi:MAG: hypothetical protein ACR2PS_09870 [Pseudomonadales bacterium]